jgi:hypothetical protein
MREPWWQKHLYAINVMPASQFFQIHGCDFVDRLQTVDRFSRGSPPEFGRHQISHIPRLTLAQAVNPNSYMQALRSIRLRGRCRLTGQREAMSLTFHHPRPLGCAAIHHVIAAGD